MSRDVASHSYELSRRAFLAAGASALAASASAADAPRPSFDTRGVVLYPWDLSWSQWPARCAAAGVNTIALHAARRLDVLVEFVRSDRGEQFLAECRQLGVAIEYELHAMGDLLSRELFYQDAALFRVDATGQRNLDFNFCTSSPRALALVSEKAVDYARVLAPTTGRYFFWPDDGREWCHCSKCQGLTASDQATLVENAVVAALRAHVDPNATLSHIAYQHTLAPPKSVKPHAGLFVEFAPIGRVYDRSIGDGTVQLGNIAPNPSSHAGYLEILDANLGVFGKDTAQVLEYWLDVSRFSNWERPARKLPWNRTVVAADLAEYARHGIRHITSFATWIDAQYVQAHGEPPLADYGAALREGGA